MKDTDILPSGKSILAELELEQLTVRTIKPRSKRTHYRAILNWIMRYQTSSSSSSIDYVKGLLEVFYHFCQLEEWRRAALTLAIPLNLSAKVELQEHLGIWGYYNEQIELYKQLLGKLTPAIDSVCLNGLGGAYHSLGRYQQAIDCHQQDLELARKTGNRKGEGSALGGLGNAYNALANYPEATHCYQQWLGITQDVGDCQGKAKALGNLGDINESLGRYEQAISYYQQCLTIAAEISDSMTESRANGGLANVYSHQGKYTEAVGCYQKWLKTAQDNGDRDGESKALSSTLSISDI
ncbi:MAG: tetratricopeptide repeat protein [Cyanobacteria bacterium P01_H01_bin.21]